jgi:hypothetical protein
MPEPYSESLAPKIEAASTDTKQGRLEKLAKTSIELARIVARNINTAPKLLKKLAHSEDKRTRQNVASNPNTPTNTLLNLGAEFPLELLNNPVFSLLLLENPNLVEEMPAPTLAHFIKLDLAPPEWVNIAAKHDDVQVLNALINNPKTPVEALNILIYGRTHNDNRITNTAALHVNLQEGVTQEWKKAALAELQEYSYLNHDFFKEEALWDIGIIPEDLFAALDGEAQISIAANLNPMRISKIPLEFIKKKYLYQERILLTHVLNPKASSELLKNLLKLNIDVRYQEIIYSAVARNINTPVHVLEYISKDISREVRHHAFLNLKAPLNILQNIFKKELSKYNGDNIELIKTKQYQLINNQKSSTKQIIDLLEDKNPAIRMLALGRLAVNVANNYKINGEDFKKIAQIICYKEAYSWEMITLNIAVASNPDTPTDILTHLIKYIKSLIPSRVETKAKILDKIYLIVAQNPQASVETLEYLLENSVRDIREAVVNKLQKKQKKGSLLLEDFLIQWGEIQNSNTTVEKLDELANSKWLHIREAVVFHPNVSESILERMAQDKRVPVRLAVAQNINTPTTAFTHLIRQSHPEVLFAVAENPNTPFSILEKIINHRQKYQKARKAAVINLFQRFPEQAGQVLVSYVESNRATSTKLFLLLHPIAPQGFLAKYVSSDNWRLRYAIAQNPNTPHHILEQLLNDANWIVRAEAKANICSPSPKGEKKC